jgi:hypothetical protein
MVNGPLLPVIAQTLVRLSSAGLTADVWRLESIKNTFAPEPATA